MAITGVINEPTVSDGAVGIGVPTVPYRAGWYAQKETSYLKDVGKPATKHCDGSELLPSDVDMVRVDAPCLVNSIDWNANGVLDLTGQLDVNFNGKIEQLKVASNDWANIRLQELAGQAKRGRIVP